MSAAVVTLELLRPRRTLFQAISDYEATTGAGHYTALEPETHTVTLSDDAKIERYNRVLRLASYELRLFCLREQKKYRA